VAGIAARFAWWIFVPGPDALANQSELAMSLEEPQRRVREARDPVLVDLALQGGGSHGAFTWGVL